MHPKLWQREKQQREGRKTEAKGTYLWKHLRHICILNKINSRSKETIIIKSLSTSSRPFNTKSASPWCSPWSKFTHTIKTLLCNYKMAHAHFKSVLFLAKYMEGAIWKGTFAHMLKLFTWVENYTQFQTYACNVNKGQVPYNRERKEAT